MARAMDDTGTIEVVADPAGVELHAGGEAWLRAAEPVHLMVLGAEPVAASYETFEDGRGSATLTAADGTAVEVTDTWRVVDADTVEVERRATVLEAGTGAGLRLELRAQTVAPGTASLDDWEFFIPGTLYKHNDTNHDGVEDYLGTYEQDHRDDRLGSLTVLAYAPQRRRYVALSRADLPAFDPLVTDDQLRARQFVQDTDIGSLGLRPTDGERQVELRASYPFCEQHSFCLNTAGDGWAAHAPNEAGRTLSATYRLRVVEAPSLTDAIWDVTRRQMATLGTAPRRPGFTLEEALVQRNLLTQQFFRSWSADDDPREPAGYMVHFSPRSGQTLGSLLEYGFSGAQTLLAYASIEHAHRQGVPLWAQRARQVVQFFVDHVQEPNGFSHGMYDVTRADFVHWFTGVLMPFQYAEDDDEVRRYLGAQVTEALAPVARELRELEGNYTRTMCESIYPVLLAYRAERDRGNDHPDWLEAGRRFGEFLLRAQAEDGSWHRAYDVAGVALEQPAAWFGATDTERKSGTIFPVEALVTLHELTGDERYLAAAQRAGDFIARTYVDPVEYVGGLNDTTHVKSVKTDSVGVMFVMRSLIKLHRATGEQRHLDAAVKAAKILASWVYLWDVPFEPDSTLGAAGFKSTGWAVCDVLPGGSYLDNELLEFTGDLVDVAVASGDEALFDVAEIVEFGMHHALSMPSNMHGYVAPGIQCEGIMTAYWMSEPEHTEFSGAVNKVKGQDNDTCNGLTNGQAAYALFELEDRYGTIDFGLLRERLFPPLRAS
jgi:hypothetical protein